MASYDEAIPPGQAGQLTITLHTGSLRGKQSRVATLTTNDPERPNASVWFKARVVGSVLLLPQPSLSVGTGRRRGSTSRVLVRKDPGEEGELIVSKLTTDRSWLRATARRVETNEPAGDGLPPARAGDWVLEVALDESPPRGLHRESLRFETGLTREKEVRIPVMVSVIPPVTLNPETLALPEPPAGESARGMVVAVVRRDRATEPIRVEAEPRAFSVDLQKRGDRQYQLFVSWTPGDDHTVREGIVTVYVGKESVQIPVRIGDAGGVTAAGRGVTE